MWAARTRMWVFCARFPHSEGDFFCFVLFTIIQTLYNIHTSREREQETEKHRPGKKNVPNLPRSISISNGYCQLVNSSTGRDCLSTFFLFGSLVNFYYRAARVVDPKLAAPFSGLFFVSFFLTIFRQALEFLPRTGRENEDNGCLGDERLHQLISDRL